MKYKGYNIIQVFNISSAATAIFCLFLPTANAQELATSKYGLKVVNSIPLYKSMVAKDSNQQMIDLNFIPGLVLDLRYASTNNFMKQQLYPDGTTHTYLRKPAALALANVQKELLSKGYGLKIFDAYRPYATTVKFWELVHDPQYVADPSKGSGHNRGIAVDLTIIDLATHKEIEMPTGFDNFTDSAHHDFTQLSPKVLANRKLLKETMEKYGFVEFPTEWWHYSLPDPERFAPMDISFEELMKNK